MGPIRKHAPAIFGTIAVIVILYTLFVTLDGVLRPGYKRSSDPNAFVPPPIAPPRSESNTTAVEQEKSFDLLASYTNGGFSPRETTIAKGQTVRFTNNSSASMQIKIATTSTKLAPGEYWQYTFEKAAVWNIADELKATHTATITVQ